MNEDERRTGHRRPPVKFRQAGRTIVLLSVARLIIILAAVVMIVFFIANTRECDI